MFLPGSPYHPSRRVFAAAAGLAAASLAAGPLRAQSRPEKSKIVISVGRKASFFHLPLTIAEQLGYFHAEGLEVEIVDFGSGINSLQAIAAGVADVCAGAFMHTISLQSRDRFFRAFVMQGRAPQVVTAVSARAMPRYRSIPDLRGRRIGISAMGSATNMAASLLLAQGGVRPDEVTFVDVGTGADALHALRSGGIDAISNVDPLITQLEQRGDVRVISDTRTLKGTQEMFGGPLPAACLYAPEDFVQKHPRTVQALADAMVHGLKWLQTAGPADIVKTVPEKYLLGDRALYLASFEKVREAISPDGLVPDDGPRTAVRAASLFEPGFKAGKIELPRLYTNDFARRAKQKFQA
jgi:NitT/TauT family transport system substrate-binding protein